MDSSTISKQIIHSMQTDPDSWTGHSVGATKYLRSKAGIDVAVSSSYYVDLKDRGVFFRLDLGFWDHMKIREAAKALLREKTMRALERYEAKLLPGPDEL